MYILLHILIDFNYFNPDISKFYIIIFLKNMYYKFIKFLN
jgi:hypothetical protein